MNRTISQSGVMLNDIIVVTKDITALELFMLFQDKRLDLAFINDKTIKDKKGQLFFTVIFYLILCKNIHCAFRKKIYLSIQNRKIP